MHLIVGHVAPQLRHWTLALLPRWKCFVSVWPSHLDGDQRSGLH